MVTGGAGFIGSHLVERLVARGDVVAVVDDFNDFYDPAIKWTNCAAFGSHRNASVHQGDIRDAAFLAAVFASFCPDRVVHLAARAGVRPSIAAPHLYEATNVLGTLNLLEACRHGGIKKFIFASSSSVYGVNSKVPFSETDSISRVISPYAATKVAGEAFCQTYAHLYGMTITCLRFFTAYGPRQRPDLAIHKFARLIDTGQPIPLFGDGSSKRDYTYIDDIVEGVIAALAYEATQFEIINLGDSHTVALVDLVALLEAAIGKKAAIDWQPAQPGDVPITFADIGKARQLLGYAPKITIEGGLQKYTEWLRAVGMSAGNRGVSKG